MKIIKITEKNLEQIYGTMKKFFYNKNKTGFTSWHNYDCGFKHIKKTVKDKELGKISTEHIYPAPRLFELDKKMKLIRIHLISGEGFCIRIGDEVALMSGKIIIKTKEVFLPNYHYCYEVFQAKKLTVNDEKNINTREKINQIETNFYD